MLRVHMVKKRLEASLELMLSLDLEGRPFHTVGADERHHSVRNA